MTTAMDRAGLAELMTAAMTGDHEQSVGLPFRLQSGEVKTFAIEVNGDADVPREVDRLGRAVGLRSLETADPALAILWDDASGLFVDVLDERFWLVHTTGPKGWVQPKLQNLVARSRNVDWCWLTTSMMNDLRVRGMQRWFKADFKGQDLLPSEGTRGRRLKVQLEGDNPDELQSLLVDGGYRSSTALTGVALRLQSAELGSVQEAAYYRGSFSARGDSFDLHLGFVAAVVGAYAEEVRDVERRFAIRWGGEEGHGWELTAGGVITISFARPIVSFDQFLDGLFSCREPFRLWSVPRAAGDDFVEAEVVDLHVGQRFRLDITRGGLRVYLFDGACGNTLFRLLANLQHRYDAAASSPDLPRRQPAHPRSSAQ